MLLLVTAMPFGRVIDKNGNRSKCKGFVCVEAEHLASGVSATHATVGSARDVYREVNHTSA